MRDLRKGRKLGRERNQRRALLRGLAVNLISHGKIKTTTAKAKELRPMIERLVTRTKKSGPIAYQALRRVLPPKAAAKLVKEISPRYSDRKGGYTRIIKAPVRTRDAASISFIEFV